MNEHICPVPVDRGTGFRACGERATWVWRNRDKAGYRCDDHVAGFRKPAFEDLAAAGLFSLKRLED